jgi:hypothetical protein
LRSRRARCGGGLYPGNVGDYHLNAALDWTDRGAKVGLDTTYDIAKGHSAGLGGFVGLVRCSASMSANSSFLFGAPLFPNLSTVQDSRTTTSVLANAEASMIARVAPNVMVRGFVGLNYDSKVPGIAAPESVVFTVSGNPAHIRFEATTSYYAGGGVTIGFAP